MKNHELEFDCLNEVLFHDFQKIRIMKSSEAIKVKLLSALLSANPNCWRVVGISPNALDVFAKNDFKRVSKMGINRSHVFQRNQVYKEMLKTGFVNKEEFWEYYYSRDYTILATSNENMQDVDLEAVALPVPQDGRMLFRTRGYVWKHDEAEICFLQGLFFASRQIE